MTTPTNPRRRLVAIILGVLIAGFYFLSTLDVIKLLANFLNFIGIESLIAGFERAIDYKTVASSLGFVGGFAPFLSWQNMQIWGFSLLSATMIIVFVTYFIPNRSLISEPVTVSTINSVRPFNINTNRFPVYRSRGVELEVCKAVSGIPRGIAESILAASAKHLDEYKDADAVKTVLRFRIAAISLVHRRVEERTGRLLGILESFGKLVVCSASVLIFFGLIDISEIKGNLYYSCAFLTSILLVNVIGQLAKEGKYGMCQDMIPKLLAKRYLRKREGRSNLMEFFLLAPQLALYKVKEKAVVDMYSTRSYNYAREDIELKDLQDALDAYRVDGADDQLI